VDGRHVVVGGIIKIIIIIIASAVQASGAVLGVGAVPWQLWV